MSSDNQLQQAVLAGIEMGAQRDGAHIRRRRERWRRNSLGLCREFCGETGSRDGGAAGEGREGFGRRDRGSASLCSKKTRRRNRRGGPGSSAWDVSVPPDAVKVKVEKGRITLTGQVDWQISETSRRAGCARAIWRRGRLHSDLHQAKGQHVEFSDDIMHALHRSWFSTRRPST